MQKEVVTGQTRAVRRRLDVKQRKAEILHAARELYAQSAYDQVSTTQISRASESSQALIFHYFDTKADLYAEVIRTEIQEVRDAQETANAQLPDGVPARDRVRIAIEVYLDYIAAHRTAWATPFRDGSEPEAAQRVRADARKNSVDRLATLLGIEGWTRHVYALHGYFGFLDRACLHWVEEDCPAEERNPLIEATLGALEGALGDWRG